MEHFSFSSTSTYLMCPIRWEFRYVKGIKIPPNGALTLGGTFHETTEHNFIQKKKTKKDLKLSVLQDVFRDKFKLKSKETDWKEEKQEDCHKQGIALVSLFSKEAAPKIQPLLVEAKFELNIPNIKPKMTTRIDLVDSNLIIRDFKTSSKTPAEGDIKKNLQLPLYCLAYRGITQQQENGVYLDYFIKTKTPKYLTFPEAGKPEIITEKRINQALYVVENVLKSIEAGIFYPRNDGWHCSEKWCGYWNLCEHR